MTTKDQSKYNTLECTREATAVCGTWDFCTEHAVSEAHVVLDEDGRGLGDWGSAYASDPDIVAAIRVTQREFTLSIPYQP